MAHIVIYDANERDREQLTSGLTGSDHYWEYVDDSINEHNLQESAEVISVFVSSKVTRELIDKMPRLRLIACRSTGFNNVDLAAAAEHNITVINVPTYGEHTVAEYAFGLLLTLTRKIPQTVDATKAGITEHDNLTGTDLSEKTIGIVGTGRIGLNAIRIAKGFNMKVLAYDPYPNQAAATELGFEYVDLHDLLAASDVISLHAPYTPGSHHLLHAGNIDRIKYGAYLINTARGELVNTTALVNALTSGSLAGAALDVLESESLISMDEEALLLRRGKTDPIVLKRSLEINVLERMPNVIITNHNAFNTLEAIGRINSITARNILQFWYGEVPNRVELPAPDTNKAGKLLLVRHAESEWNASGKWTGITDVHLSEKGYREAAMLGEAMKDIHIDYAYHSQQIRTRETLEAIIDATGQLDMPFETAPAINERDYGIYTGKNKWEIKEEIGEQAFNDLRRGWNVPVPNGETLKNVYDRAVPFYKDEILRR